MRRIFLYLLVLMAVMTACTDNDSFSTSRSCLLTFSKDTVKLDTVFSTVGSSTYTFWVYNNSGDGIRLNTVRLKNGNQTGFRVNVDGSYLDNTLGSVVTDLEVRQGDSIRVFVELTAPENQQQQPQVVEDDLLFSLESGMVQQVHLHGYAWDALMLSDLVVSSDTIVESTKPIVLYGKGIEVDSGAVLTLRGTTLYFHDKAGITVRGTLKTEQVLMRGDRLDHMFDYLPYDGVSGQWEGISFADSSLGNELIDTEIRNAMNAVVVDSAAVDTLVQRLTMTRCIVHNAKGHGVIAYSSNIGLYYCQLTNTWGDCLALYGGCADIDHCTLAQFYPFKADRGAALRFIGTDDMRLTCRNSIVTGYEDDVVMAGRVDTTHVYRYRFSDCLLRTPAVTNDSVSFRNIQWETPTDSVQGKQHFVKIDEKNLVYDFHLDSLSTAKGKGCYEFKTP
jgi:hypothetical protein